MRYKPKIGKYSFKLLITASLLLAISFIPKAYALTKDINLNATNYSINKENKISLYYNIYAGGFKALRASLKMDLNKDKYKMSLNAKTQGLIGKIFPWKTSMQTSGHNEKGKLIPSNHDESSTWKTSTKITKMDYANNGKILKTSVEKKGHIKTNNNINDILSNNAVDILTGALNMMQNAKNTNKCHGSFPVFDGKRRFNITLADNGKEIFKKSRYSKFSGEALRCTLKVKPVAGFNKKDAHRGWMAVQAHTEKRNKLPTLWLGKIKGSDQMVPVRMEISSAYGSVIAHLAQKDIN